VQDPDGAVRSAMPAAAIAAGGADEILGLAEIGPALIALADTADREQE